MISRALEALCAAVPTELGTSLANKAMTKLAWESIVVARIGGDRVRRATLQRLRREWEGEQVKDFPLRLTNLLEQMARNGDTELTEDQRGGEIPSMHAEEASTAAARRRRRDPGARSGADGGAAGERKATQDDTYNNYGRINNYGRTRHWAKDCRLPPCHGGQAHIAQAEEQDATLFLAHGCIELQQDIGEGVKGPNFPLSRSTSFAELHLDESRTHAFLNKGTTDDKINSWYLDTGATHHITGRHEFFSDLDSSVKGSIKFGDASAVEIKGIGSIIFKAKMGEHRLLIGVYYIPTLKNSIISVGQLDENGSWVEIEDGVLHIWDTGRHLLAKVAHPLCLVARRNDEAWRWHERFGHLHFEALKQLGKKEMVHGMPYIDHVDQLYNTCVVTKLKHQPFPRQASYRTTEQLELVHGDLCGLVSSATLEGRR
ncbi:uncharacterized protein [Miscanthus floridulus]|uniref:uncharacterized protein n=1 Tax=Miscanthus floridulus TaxID=154761 RepID=UPI00345A44AD